ncbi:MAG: hypothetical protein ACRCXT_16350 [Paraclostridium sp.]
MKLIGKVGTLSGIEIDYDLEISMIRDAMGNKNKNISLILKSIYLLKSNLPHQFGLYYDRLSSMEWETTLINALTEGNKIGVPLNRIWGR